MGLRRAVAQEAAARSGEAPGGDGPTGLRLPFRLLLRPSVSLSAGYDSNLFYQDAGTRQSATLQVQPQLSLEPQGTRNISPRLGVSLTYTEFLSQDSEIQELRSLSADVAAGVSVVAPSERFRLAVDDHYSRVVMPPYQPGGRQFTSNNNGLSLHSGIQPAGPRLKLDLGYSLTHTWFDETALRFATNHSQAFAAGVAWHVLPRTSAGLAATLGVIGYEQASKSASYPLHLVVNASTALTERLAITARAGFGKSFYEKTRTADDEAIMFVLGFDAKYQTAAFLFGLAYGRDFQDSLWANYYATDKVTVDARRAMSSKTGISTSLSYDRRRFAPPPTPLTGERYLSSERTDHVITLQLAADHAFSPRMSASLGYSLNANRSNFHLVSGEAQTPNDVSYYKHGVRASLRVVF